MALNVGKSYIGKSFPDSLTKEDFSFSEDLKNLRRIYNSIINHYENMEWSLQDFKEFRHGLIRFNIDEFVQSQDLICYFVSLPLSDMVRRITELNQDLKFEIFTKTVLSTRNDSKPGEESEKDYITVERKCKVNDIIEIVKRINKLPYVLGIQGTTKAIASEGTTRVEKLAYCDRLLQSESTEFELLVKSITQVYEEMCTKVRDETVLTHLQVQKEHLAEIVMAEIKNYYQREKRKEFQEKQSPIQNYRSENKMKWKACNAKKAKVKYGYQKKV